MEGHSDPSCEWYNCQSRAFRQVGFGGRFESAEPNPETSPPPEHLTLCGTHLAEIRSTYMEVNAGALTGH